MRGLRGSYDVVINSRRLQYKFTIRRNVTVIRGQSATGKTTMVEMIRDCNEHGIDSGITISCDRDCVAAAGKSNLAGMVMESHEPVLVIADGAAFGPGEFAIHIINTDQVVRSMKELVPIAIRYV